MKYGIKQIFSPLHLIVWKEFSLGKVKLLPNFTRYSWFSITGNCPAAIRHSTWHIQSHTHNIITRARTRTRKTHVHIRATPSKSEQDHFVKMAYPGYGAPFGSQPPQVSLNIDLSWFITSYTHTLWQDPLWPFFSAVAGQDGQIDALELQTCLTRSGIGGTYERT